MEQIKLKAYGKVNLCLDILGTREDGYHEVRMVMQTVGIYDRLTMERQAQAAISLETNLPYLPVGEQNLVYRAIDLLRQEFGIHEGVAVKLQKFIPVSAGMAGGSADAAAALVGMNRMFHLRLGRRELMERGVKLGADVPYCILRGTALAEGIGERLTMLPPPPSCHVLLVKPKVNVSTKQAYEAYDACRDIRHPDVDGMLRALRKKDLRALAAKMGNVLEKVTAAEYPVIGEIEQEMRDCGALEAMMTGSGPTVFGLFRRRADAERARERLRSDPRIRQIYLTGWFR